MRRSDQEGFTLVELAIVLVIVGLLIGGILVAQSIMSAAIITKQVRQIQQFDIAASNFQTNYKALPGDSPAVGCVNNGNVCNNGLVETRGGGDSGWAWSDAEICNFWSDLSKTLMLRDGRTYTNGGGPVNMTAGVNMPISEVDKAVGVVAYGIVSRQSNFYLLTGGSGYQGPAGVPWAGLDNFTALAVDKKMDDGNGWTGKIVAHPGTTPGNAAGVGAWCLKGSNGAYDLKNAYSRDRNCLLQVEMFSQGQ